MKYEDLTQRQKEEICNGCGGKGSIIKPPYAAFYETNCNKHDFSYYVGYAEEHRLKADKGLRKAMKKDCDRLPWYKQLKYRPWCNIYYASIRLMGKKYFHYGYSERYPTS